MQILLEPTNACNMKCVGCGTHNLIRRKKGYMSLSTVDNIFPSRFIDFVHLFHYGESFLHKDLFEIVRKIKKHDRAIRIFCSTNGMFFDEKNVEAILDSGIDEISVAIDGTTQDVFERYRVNGNLKTIMDGMERLIKRKNELGLHHPIINWQFIAFNFNDHQIEDAIELAKNIGVNRFYAKNTPSKTLASAKFQRVIKDGVMVAGDVFTFIPPPSQTEHASLALRNQKEWFRVLNNVGLSEKELILNSICYRPVVLWNGVVNFCCWDAHAESYLGDVRLERFDDIIEGPIYKSFLTTLHRGYNTFCNSINCTMRPVPREDDVFALPNELFSYKSQCAQPKTFLIEKIANLESRASSENKSDHLNLIGASLTNACSAILTEKDDFLSIGSNTILPRDVGIKGYIGPVRQEGDCLIIDGWACDTVNCTPANTVCFFINNMLLFIAPVSISRLDVAASLDNQNAINSGFQLTIPLQLKTAFNRESLRVFGVTKDNRCNELKFSVKF